MINLKNLGYIKIEKKSTIMINIKESLTQFPNALSLCQLLLNEGGQVRFIGGAVRDVIIGRKVADIDLATDLIPDKVERILEKNSIKYLSLGKAFGTITAIVNDQKIEITTLRKDIEFDGRHAKVSFSNNWKEDALRRDFTINAMSADLEGNVYDYFGGLEDLKQNIVRFIGNPEQRIAEDYLRILRFFRFSAYFAKEIDEEGLAACVKYADKFSSISVSRFKVEMSKIFINPNGFKMIELMQKHKILPCGEGAVIYFRKLKAVTEVFNHKSSELMNFAAILRGFAQPELIINNSAFSSIEAKLLEELVFSDIKIFDIESLKLNWQKYKYNFQAVILINLAVNDTELKQELKENLDRLFVKGIQALPIRGKDLVEIGIKPGKKMGELLFIAEKLWYKNEFNISKEELMLYIKNYAENSIALT